MTRPFDSGERESQLKATREKTTAERTDDARRHFFQVWMVIGAAALIYMFGFVLDVLSLPVAIIVWTIVFVLVLRSPVAAFAAVWERPLHLRACSRCSPHLL